MPKLTHGQTNSYVYKKWRNMVYSTMQRYRKAQKQFDIDTMGQSGDIRCNFIDPRWLRFIPFLEDMGQPKEGQVLVKVHRNRPYEKGNCFWGYPAQQKRAKNEKEAAPAKDKYARINFKELAKRLGTNPHTLYMRVKRGWPLFRLDFPVKKRTKKIKVSVDDF